MLHFNNLKLSYFSLIIYFIYNQGEVIAQNLIPNGGFEEIHTCPTNFSAVGTFCCVENWFSPTSFGSPDLFSTGACDVYAQIPDNYYFGNILPKEGKNISGFQLYSEWTSSSFIDYKAGEYMSIKLTESLKQGKIYCLSFSVFNVVHYDYSNLNIKNWGILFSNYHPNGFVYLNWNDSATILIDDYFNYNENWNDFNLLFIANGGEQYMTLGSVFGDYLIDTLHLINHPLPSKLYAFFDDFSLDCCDPRGCDEVGVTSPDASKITFNNLLSKNEAFEIKGAKQGSILQVYNMSGQLVHETKQIQWSSSGAVQGMYFFRLKEPNGAVQHGKIIVQ